MDYTTTVLHRLKRYPTYQFHAEIRSDQLTVPDIFRRCILETFQWIRQRLKNSDSIPEELVTPEPEDYASFSEDRLFSFTLDLGWKADVSYVPEQGIWAFALRETDMGANIGRPNERQPVLGRIFKTDISFIRCGDHVECGVRTVCTEPVDCKEPCEVFRPAVVKALLINPQLNLSHGGTALDAKPFLIATKADAERFVSVYQNPRFDYPLIVIAEAGFEAETPPADITLPKPGGISLQFGTPSLFQNPGTLSVGLNGATKPFLTEQQPKPEKKLVPKQKRKKEAVRLPEFPCARLAESTKGFGIVCHVSEKMCTVLENKLHLRLAPGDIVICVRGKENDRLPYAAYSGDMETAYQQLKHEIQNLPKHRAYDFGKVVFQADAHLIALRERRDAAQSLEESCALYQQENAELKARLSELEQQDTDLRERNERLRITIKQLQSAQDEIEELQIYIHALQEEYQARQTAYEKSAELVRFYKDKAEIAAGFPIDKDMVCDWAEEQFPDTLIITQRARSELRKYHGSLDVALLCDGLLYLNAYTKTRNGELTEEQLQLYTDQRNWEVSLCGREAVRLNENDYTVTHEGQKYILDMHIKYGNRAANLIRIYFCRDDKNGKIIVGSMPEHLATASQTT